MARSIEATGRNVAEATAKALRELGVPAAQAEITVISRGRPRFFGLLPGSPARVRVAHKVSLRDEAEALVGEILRRMRFSTQLDVEERRHGLYINIETVGADALLMGKGGVTLASLEYLVNRLLQQDDVKGYYVTLDVAGHKRAHGQDSGGHEPQQERSRRPRRGRGGRDARGESRDSRQPAQQGEPAGGGAQGRPSGRPGGRRRSSRGRRRRGGGPRPATSGGGPQAS